MDQQELQPELGIEASGPNACQEACQGHEKNIDAQKSREFRNFHTNQGPKRADGQIAEVGRTVQGDSDGEARNEVGFGFFRTSPVQGRRVG